MRTARCVALLLALLALAGCAAAPVVGQKNAGNYVLSGETASGDAYQGGMKITPHGVGFDVDWQRSPALESRGFGLQLDQVLGVVAEDGDRYPGVVLYRVEGGHLEGIWRYDGGSGGLGTEDLDGPAGLDGAYTITLGKNPGGRRYYGSVTIKKTGDIYLVDWSVPKPRSYLGTGVLLGDIFVVGYSADRRSGVAAYCMDSAAVEGLTGRAMDTAAGVEILWRPDAKAPEDAGKRLRDLRHGGVVRPCGGSTVERDSPRQPGEALLAAR